MEKSISKAPGKLGNGMNKEKSRLPERNSYKFRRMVLVGNNSGAGFRIAEH